MSRGKRLVSRRSVRAVALAASLLLTGAGSIWAGGEKITTAAQAAPALTEAPASDVYLGTFNFTLNKAAPTADLTAITLTHYGSASAGSITNVRLLADGDADPLNGGTTQYGATVTSLSGSDASFSDPAPSVIWVGTGQLTIYGHVYADVSSAAIGSTVGFELSSGSAQTWSQTYNDGSSYPVQLGPTTIQSSNLPPSASVTDPADASSIGGPGPYSITGTASDTDGTVTAVDVQIVRSGPEYWNGSGWTSTLTWVGATGTTSWSYSWAWTLDMEAAVTVTARATDDQAATGTSPTSSTTVDTWAPRISNGVRFQTSPASGDATFTLLSDWNEANPGTPRFDYNLNAAGYLGYVLGSTGNSSSRSFSVTLDGDDAFTAIKSDHADTFGNGPTESTGPGPYYVLPLVPAQPTASNNGSSSSLNITVQANGAEAGAVTYAIQCYDDVGTPIGWVQSNPGGCSGGAVWQTAGAWTSPVVVTGLSPSTTYQFATAAGNPQDGSPTSGENSASAYSTLASATTSSGNTAPVVTISSPTGGANYNQGDSVTFTGTAIDAEDGDISAGLDWSSNLDGTFATNQSSFSYSSLSVGTHTITASVTDSGLLTGQDQKSITINAVVNGVTPGTPSAAIDGCNQITVTAPFTGDSNTNSTTLFERSPDGSTGWTAVSSCGTSGIVSGASPRVCVDTTVTDNSTNYYQVTFSDGDGVSGTNPQVIGPYDTTPYCGVDGTTINTPEAEGSSCSQITVLARFAGDDNQNGWTQVESSPAGAGTWTTACAKLTGGSPRECLIPSLLESTSYDVRITYTDGDGIAGTNPETLGSISTRACGADGTAPTVLVLSPTRGGTVSGTDTVKVQVYDAVGATSVQWSVDQTGDTGLAAASVNANYDCGTGCNVYEFALDTAGLLTGSHYLTIKASDAAGNLARVSQPFHVDSAVGGDGRLLRRTRGAQLCLDCHNLKTHSSQSTSSKYGNWAIACDTCHTPHKTRNLFLIREEIQTPNSDHRPVRFETTTGAIASSSAPGSASYANEDNASQSDGPCQVCHTRTKSSGGAARWRNADAGGNADTHYGSAATSRCVVCHSHDGGFSGAGGACNACHNAPPTVGKHGTHDQVGTLPTDYAATTNHATSTQYGFACAKCHSGGHINDATNNPTHTGTNTNPWQVEITFDTTTAPTNPSGGYAQTYKQSQDQGPGGQYWSWSDGTCSNLYCHSNANRIGTNSYATVTWNQVSALTCTSCHDAGGAATTLSGAHAKHTNASTYDFGCVRCHDATLDTGLNDITPTAVADKTQHVDGTRTLQFDTSGPDNSGGSYSQDPGYTCSNTYCHSNGQNKIAPFTSGPSIAWNTTEAADCTSCHGGNAGAATTMSSGRHTAHVASSSLTANGGVLGVVYECATCHANTVTAGNDRAITGYANHVNGAATVAGALTDASYVSPTCDNAYCHSSGQATPEYYSPVWTSGSLDCKGCHGNHSSPAFTSQFGEPNYTSGAAGSATANSHKKHVGAVTDCAICHQDTTTTGTSIKSGSILHTNQTRNVTWDATRTTAGATYTPGGGTPKSCGSTGSACHSTGTPQWGGTVVCIDCHGAAADSDNWIINDGVASQINTTEWGYSGHGKASGNYDGTGNAAANFGAGGPNPCLYCHDDQVNHKVGTNPFRLRSLSLNQVCLNCHGSSFSGVDPDGSGGDPTYALITASKKINANHWAEKHGSDPTKGGYFCWDCHDPHGDRVSGSGNIAMVGSAVSKTSDGSYGIPATTAAPVFTARTTGTDFAKSASPWNGVCNVCHTTTNNYTSTSGNGHNSTLVCSQSGCHTHDQPPNKAFYSGESNGNDDCQSCHSFGMLTSETSTKGNTFHHVMETANNISGTTVYPTNATPTEATGNLDKSCTQCHADHNVFRPDINTGNTIGRGANLRTRIANGPPSAADGVGLNAAPGDTSGSYFSNKDADASFQNGGICLSCHINPQTKRLLGDQATYTGDPGQTTAVVSAAANFPASAHGFTVPGQIAKDSSPFSVACAKCHGSDTSVRQDGTYKFVVHTSSNRRLLQTLGITSPGDPLAENFCYRCHSRSTGDTTPGGGPAKATANRDYYNQADMSSQSQLIFNVVTNNSTYPFGHPVSGSGGVHDPLEGATANNGDLSGSQRHIQCEDCHNPHAAAPIASGAYKGSVTSYSTNADPNPDVLTDSTKSWATNALKGFTVKITSGTQIGKSSTIYANTATTLSVNFGTAPPNGSSFIIVNTGVTSANSTLAGNRISGAMMDVWGVAPTWPAQPTPPTWNDSSGLATAAEITTQYNAIATWNRTSSATVQGQICIKCHSAFAYGSTPPNTPSGAGTSTATAWSNTVGATTAQSDIANQFNPNNLAHHAVFARGRNQPVMANFAQSAVTAVVNPNWPKYSTSNSADTVSVTSGSAAFGGTAAFPTTALPGWYLYVGSDSPPTTPTGGSVVSRTTTNQLYFKPQAEALQPNDLASPTPPDNQSGDTWAAGTSADNNLRSMSPGVPTAASETISVSTGRKTGSFRAYTFVSPPVTGGSLSSGTWTLRIYDSASSASIANVRYYAYVWRANGTKGTVIAGPANFGTAIPTSTSLQTITFTGAATGALAAGDKIAIDVYFNVTVAGNYTVNYVSGSANQGSLQLPGSLEFERSSLGGFLEITSIAAGNSFNVRACADSTCSSYTTAVTIGATSNWAVTAGLGNNFVPPYGPWSTLSCSDCHTSSVPSDPFGPHGSAIKWLLRGGEAQNFLFWNGTSTATVTYTPNANNVCLNCHRRNVYGDWNFFATFGSAPGNYARQGHPPDSSNQSSLVDNNKWGIVCMNCHGGARIGQVHGSNLGKGGGGGTGASYSGRRLLAGSTWYAVTRSSTTTPGSCWTKGSADAVDNCAHSHSGVGFQSGVANYDYESGAD